MRLNDNWDSFFFIFIESNINIRFVQFPFTKYFLSCNFVLEFCFFVYFIGDSNSFAFTVRTFCNVLMLHLYVQFLLVVRTASMIIGDASLIMFIERAFFHQMRGVEWTSVQFWTTIIFLAFDQMIRHAGVWHNMLWIVWTENGIIFTIIHFDLPFAGSGKSSKTFLFAYLQSKLMPNLH